MLVSGKLRVFRNLKLFLMQYGLYRRDERHHIIRERSELMECLQALVLTVWLIRRKRPEKPDPPPAPKNWYSDRSSGGSSGPDGWMGM
jgi:hypothetical protein